jgi:cytochrome c-type biogenesis protein CcmH/NrfG
MTFQPGSAAASRTSAWQAKQVYVLAAVCLLLGLTAGYLLRGSQPLTAPALENHKGGQMTTLEQMNDVAEKRAAPLLQKLETKPNDGSLLIQLGDVYKQNHQFKEAAEYYNRSLKADPNNAGVRSDLASCLYYTGDLDGALAQLQEALRFDPRSAPALFNLGMINWQGKKDAKTAIAAWEELLRSNPQLGADRKAAVQKLIAEARQQSSQAN